MVTIEERLTIMSTILSEMKKSREQAMGRIDYLLEALSNSLEEEEEEDEDEPMLHEKKATVVEPAVDHNMAVQVTHTAKSTLTLTVTGDLSEDLVVEHPRVIESDENGVEKLEQNVFVAELFSVYTVNNIEQHKHPVRFRSEEELDEKGGLRTTVVDFYVFGSESLCCVFSKGGRIQDARKVFVIMLERGFAREVQGVSTGSESKHCVGYVKNVGMSLEKVGVSLEKGAIIGGSTSSLEVLGKVDQVVVHHNVAGFERTGVGDASLSFLGLKVEQKGAIVSNVKVLGEAEQDEFHGTSAHCDENKAAWNRTEILDECSMGEGYKELLHDGRWSELDQKLFWQGDVTMRMIAIEEMAGIDVLGSDSSGTLPMNKLIVEKILIMVFAERVDPHAVNLMAASASKTEGQDATKVAVVRMLADPNENNAGIPVVQFLPFDLIDKEFDLIDKEAALTCINSERKTYHRSALVGMNGECGSIQYCGQALNKMAEKNLIIWKALMSNVHRDCSRGRLEHGLVTFELVRERLVATGNWEDAKFVSKIMIDARICAEAIVDQIDNVLIQKYLHQGAWVSFPVTLFGAQSMEGVIECTCLDLQTECRETHLFCGTVTFRAGTLKDDILYFFYILVQLTAPIRAEIDVNLGIRRQWNVKRGRLKSSLYLRQLKKKKMVIREEEPTPAQWFPYAYKAITWISIILVPELILVAYDIDGLYLRVQLFNDELIEDILDSGRHQRQCRVETQVQVPRKSSTSVNDIGEFDQEPKIFYLSSFLRTRNLSGREADTNLSNTDGMLVPYWLAMEGETISERPTVERSRIDLKEQKGGNSNKEDSSARRNTGSQLSSSSSTTGLNFEYFEGAQSHEDLAIHGADNHPEAFFHQDQAYMDFNTIVVAAVSVLGIQNKDAQMNFAIKDDELNFVDYVREDAWEKCGYEYGSLDLLLVAPEELRIDNVLIATELEGLESDREFRIAIGAALESGAKIIATFIDVVWEINQAPKTFCSSSSLRTRNLSGKECYVENTHELESSGHQQMCYISKASG